MDNQNIANKVKHLHFISRKLVDTIFAGNYHSVFKGPGLEFDDVREYSWGDDPRFIDWNVTSRMSTPFYENFPGGKRGRSAGSDRYFLFSLLQRRQH